MCSCSQRQRKRLTHQQTRGQHRSVPLTLEAFRRRNASPDPVDIFLLDRCLALCRAPPAGAPSGSQSKSTDFPPPARLCVFAPRVGSRRVLSSTAAQRLVSKDCQEGLLLSGILHRFDRSLVRAVRSGVAWCWQVD